MDQWIPPIKAELESLFQKKGALKQISQEEVQRLVANDLPEVLPTSWFTLRNPQGNQNLASERPDWWPAETLLSVLNLTFLLGGATAVAGRAAVAIAAQKTWKGQACDIRTAFLNAPMKLAAADVQEGEQAPLPRKAIIKPPPLLITKPGEHWEVLMALHGYKESPKLWSDYRDTVLVDFKIPLQDGSHAVLDQMITEP